MQLCEIKAFRGRNIYSHLPVIRILANLKEYYNISTNNISDFTSSLLMLMPGLKHHRCSFEYEGGFEDQLELGTNLAHVIEHCSIEIQNMLGYRVNFGQSGPGEKRGDYIILFSYSDENAGIEAGKLSFRIVQALCNGAKIDLSDELKRIRNIVQRFGLGPSTQAIVNAATERGIPVTRIGNGSIIQLGYGKYQKKMEGTLPDTTSCISVDIACDKAITKELLDQSGIPVPKGVLCYTLNEALEVSRYIEFPLVVKPLNGNQGKGVSMKIQSEDELINAFEIASRISQGVLVEEYVRGNDYRILVVGNQVAAAAHRIPAYVIGDGKHSIEQLVEIRNRQENRGDGHEKSLTKIVIDDISINLLKKNGFTPESIPKKGLRVYLKYNGNLSTGGEAIDCTDKVHPFNQELAIRAARIIGLDIAGVDITCPNISKPLERGKGAIIEVNASPGIRMHLNPSKGKGRSVGNTIVDMLFPTESKYSIPIISITGTNGKTTTTRMIAHILRVNGHNVGMTTTDGIYINDDCVVKGDTTGPQSAKIVLADKSVDVAVLETARGGILRAGLAYDLSDVGVLTNISEDHLGLDGIKSLNDLYHVKSLVIESVKSNGYAVLNADDKIITQSVNNIRANIIYFSTQENNLVLHKHIANGGLGVFVKDGYITIATGNGLIKSLHISKIPATYNGILKYNVENCLAAISAAYSLKVPITTIETALSSFYCDELHNPGRFNLYNIRDFRVIVDYGHNIVGYEKVCEAIKKLGATQIIGVVGVPGDRTDESIRKIGQIAACSLDRILIKEDCDLRNRKRGEVAKLLREGALLAGFPNNKIDIYKDEETALKDAIKNAKSGDLIVVFYENFDCIAKIIKSEINKNSDQYNSKSKDYILARV